MLVVGERIDTSRQKIALAVEAKDSNFIMLLVTAMTSGLDAVIVDPCDTRIMANLLTAEALLGDDEYCLHYITAYREGKLNPGR